MRRTHVKSNFINHFSVYWNGITKCKPSSYFNKTENEALKDYVVSLKLTKLSVSQTTIKRGGFRSISCRLVYVTIRKLRVRI